MNFQESLRNRLRASSFGADSSLLAQFTFDPNVSSLKMSSGTMSDLNTLLEYMKQNKTAVARIEGYADPTESDVQGLSTGRATSISTWLVNHAIPKTRLRALGLGSAKPGGAHVEVYLDDGSTQSTAPLTKTGPAPSGGMALPTWAKPVGIGVAALAGLGLVYKIVAK